MAIIINFLNFVIFPSFSRFFVRFFFKERVGGEGRERTTAFLHCVLQLGFPCHSGLYMWSGKWCDRDGKSEFWGEKNSHGEPAHRWIRHTNQDDETKSKCELLVIGLSSQHFIGLFLRNKMKQTKTNGVGGTRSVRLYLKSITKQLIDCHPWHDLHVIILCNFRCNVKLSPT